MCEPQRVLDNLLNSAINDSVTPFDERLPMYESVQNGCSFDAT